MLDGPIAPGSWVENMAPGGTESAFTVARFRGRPWGVAGSSSLSRAWSDRRCGAWRRALVLGVLGCLPQRELGSYAAGAAGAVGGGDPLANASAVVPSSASPAAVDLAGAEGTRPVLQAAGDAGVPDAANDALGDAALGGALSCRTECACERRDQRDFMFCATTVTFDVATARCRAAGGTLASVDDAQHEAWLTERMQALDADDFWLSGTDAEVEGVWRWADGRVFYPFPADAGESFAPWDDQQPNDLNGEDCMRSVGGLWRDLACDAELTYVCQG